MDTGSNPFKNQFDKAKGKKQLAPKCSDYAVTLFLKHDFRLALLSFSINITVHQIGVQKIASI